MATKWAEFREILWRSSEARVGHAVCGGEGDGWDGAGGGEEGART